jgi:hypothetical protein
VWRAEDQALLGRLEDEALLEQLWARAAPGAPPLHARASGMIRAMRDLPGASDALAAAARGDIGPLLSLVTPARLAAISPALIHHLAVFHKARVDHALGREPTSEPARASMIDRALSLVIACWLALGREGAYLARLAEDVAGGALPAEVIHRAVVSAPLRGIDAVAAIARRSEDAGSSHGVAALARIDEALAIAEVSGELAARARARATAAHAEVVAAKIAPLALELDEIASRDWKPAEIASVLDRAHRAWREVGEDAEIERFLVRELPRFAWDLYRERRWDELRALLRPIERPTDRLARRIEADPREIAWAAQCAQALVFRAELAPTLETQIALAERGLRLCPTLRNARLVLADLLGARAERRIDQPLLLRGTDGWAVAARDVERAAEIYPELKRLPALRARLRSRGAA